MNKVPAAALLAALLLSGTSPVQAQANRQGDAPARGGLLVQTDLEFGGDEIATVAFVDGDSQDIYAGQACHSALAAGFGRWNRPNSSCRPCWATNM